MAGIQKCNKIQESLMTDYIDSRMEGEQKARIDRHLEQCTVCHQFLLDLQVHAIGPLKYSRPVVADSILWERIKANIEENQRVSENTVDWWEKIRSFVFIPKPAFALATVLTLIFMAGTTDTIFMKTPIVQINAPDQIRYMTSLMDDSASSTGNGSDIQTPIEKYFL